MSSKILEINEQLQSFNLQKEAYESAKTNEEELVDLNRDQLRRGKTGIGETRDYRNLEYSLEKRQKSTYWAPYPRMDFFDSGDFQEQMFMKITNVAFSFYSRDIKTTDLVAAEGEEIFELNDESVIHARDIVEEDLTQKINTIFK